MKDSHFLNRLKRQNERNPKGFKSNSNKNSVGLIIEGAEIGLLKWFSSFACLGFPGKSPFINLPEKTEHGVENSHFKSPNKL